MEILNVVFYILYKGQVHTQGLICMSHILFVAGSKLPAVIPDLLMSLACLQSITGILLLLNVTGFLWSLVATLLLVATRLDAP